MWNLEGSALHISIAISETLTTLLPCQARHCCDIHSLLQIGSMQCCMQPCRTCWMENQSRSAQVQKDDITECNADGSCLTEPGVIQPMGMNALALTNNWILNFF
jgi:hypothetical protein